MIGNSLRIFIVGLINGLLLGLISKGLEILSGIKVYQLLLNVNFIPVIGEVPWNEAWLFSFHLLISIFITLSYAYIMRKRKTVRRFTFALLFIIPAVLLYFPLSVLSKTVVTLPFDFSAFSLWAFAHLIYALFLPISIQK